MSASDRHETARRWLSEHQYWERNVSDPDIVEHLLELLDAARAEGAAEERRAIVEWLRNYGKKTAYDNDWGADYADRVERGDHKPTGKP